MTLEIAHVIADAAHAEFAEVGEVLANLSRVQAKLLRQRLGRNRADAAVVEHVEAPQVDRQAVGRELGHLVGSLLGRLGLDHRLVQSFHKLKRL